MRLRSLLKGGTALATRSFPSGRHLALRGISQAAGSPTLFLAATRDQRSHSRTVEAIACLEVSSEASQHGSSDFCRSPCAAPGNQDIAATRHPSLFEQGRPPALLRPERWPCPTGLASYLSGHFLFLQSVDAVFRTACLCGEVNTACLSSK